LRPRPDAILAAFGEPKPEDAAEAGQSRAHGKASAPARHWNTLLMAPTLPAAPDD
jgi:hypothetical protein